MVRPMRLFRTTVIRSRLRLSDPVPARIPEGLPRLSTTVTASGSSSGGLKQIRTNKNLGHSKRDGTAPPRAKITPLPPQGTPRVPKENFQVIRLCGRISYYEDTTARCAVFKKIVCWENKLRRALSPAGRRTPNGAEQQWDVS